HPDAAHSRGIDPPPPIDIGCFRCRSSHTAEPGNTRVRWEGGRAEMDPREKHRQNFTCGACSSTACSSAAAKYSCGANPNIEANSAAGNCWMPVLYSCTALLKNRREAAILF